MNNWIIKDISIGEIQHLLDEYEIEVQSPDGYVPVSSFVDKGDYQEYILTTSSNKIVRCNHRHLFETTNGWKFAEDIVNQKHLFHTIDGTEEGIVTKTDNIIPIVDITIDHDNHRYYTNGVSSHNTNVGKSLFMCSVAANMLLQGRNVLYITMEMAEERIAERIDANLLDINTDDLEEIPKALFESKVKKLAQRTHGKLFVKEYPTASAHVGHFETLLRELEIKKSFRPDIIFVDYINICIPLRFAIGANINSYTMVKSIAEELRGLAVRYKLPIVTATQTTRSGFTSTDPNLADTSESFGLPATADFMFSLVSTEELENLNQILVKQLKNRFAPRQKCRKFLIGVDYEKMRLYDVSDSAQRSIHQEEHSVGTQGNFENKFRSTDNGKMERLNSRASFAEFTF